MGSAQWWDGWDGMGCGLIVYCLWVFCWITARFAWCRNAARIHEDKKLRKVSYVSGGDISHSKPYATHVIYIAVMEESQVEMCILDRI